MSNILLTGGRTPTSLQLARAFHRAGHTVFMAESLRGHLSQSSNAVSKNFLVPPPRQQTTAFIRAIKKIVNEEKIDLLIPTGDETFYLATDRERIACTVFVDTVKKMDIVRNKWYFLVTALEYELPVPETMLVRTDDDLFHAFAQWRGLILKPAYTRFAVRTLTRPTIKHALSILRTDVDSDWIAQEDIEGQHYHTYSVCHNGHITAHATYPSHFTTSRDVPIVFQPVDHPAVFQWVSSYVKENRFTGQIAFEFIHTPKGQLFALECSPGATGGVHLLASHPQFVKAFLNPQMEPITPSDHRSHMLSAEMWIHGLPMSVKRGTLRKWLSTLFTSDDAILDFKDILPFLLQFRSLFSYLMIAIKNKISPLEAPTFDIEWNGET